MSLSYTISESRTFTVTHAQHIAAKVATDLKRLQRLYGGLSDAEIREFEIEVVELLKAGYLDTVIYGYRRNGCWIEPTLRYKADYLTGDLASDSPGGIRPNANIDNASFYSYLIYNASWDNLSQNERDRFEERLPISRTGAPEPGVDGYLESDRTYSAGGRSLNRTIVRSYR